MPTRYGPRVDTPTPSKPTTRVRVAEKTRSKPSDQQASTSNAPEKKRRPNPANYDDDPSAYDALLPQYDELDMEDVLHNTLEQNLAEANKAEGWKARIMRQAWDADPRPRTGGDVQRFRVTGDAFDALKIGDPIEAMLVAQQFALHSNGLTMLREATRSGSQDLKARNCTIATKLFTTGAKLAETLQRYRSKGQQQVVVKYERQARGQQSKGKISRSAKHRLTVSKTGVEADFGNLQPDQNLAAVRPDQKTDNE